jgi:hypothetical protein
VEFLVMMVALHLFLAFTITWVTLFEEFVAMGILPLQNIRHAGFR